MKVKTAQVRGVNGDDLDNEASFYFNFPLKRKTFKSRMSVDKCVIRQRNLFKKHSHQHHQVICFLLSWHQTLMPTK